jgi:hypothetical protein
LEIGSWELFGLPQTSILPISVSRVGGITGMSSYETFCDSYRKLSNTLLKLLMLSLFYIL